MCKIVSAPRIKRIAVAFFPTTVLLSIAAIGLASCAGSNLTVSGPFGYKREVQTSGTVPEQQPIARQTSPTLTLANPNAPDTHFPDMGSGMSALRGPKIDVWHELANLLSFGFWDEPVGRPMPIPERLYIYYRRDRATGSSGFTKDMGYPAAESAVLFRLEQLQTAAANDPAMLRQVVDGAKIIGERMKVAKFNQKYGNTPDASVGQGLNMIERLHQRFESLDKSMTEDRAAQRLMSVETLKRFKDLQQSVGPKGLENLLTKETHPNGLPPPVVLSAMLLGFDANECDIQANFWRQTLLPLAMGSAGPKVSAPVIETKVEWAIDPMILEPYPLLKGVSLINRGVVPLTNVVVELSAETAFGEKKNQYYYFRNWLVGSTRTVRLHLRLAMQTYSPTLVTSGRLWSDQLASDIPATRQENPNPVPPNRDRYRMFSGDQRRLELPMQAWGNAVVLFQDLPAPRAP